MKATAKASRGTSLPYALRSFGLPEADDAVFGSGLDKEANWLPAPEGEFRLALRLYVPDKRVVDRNWAPSPIQKATE